ncbi:MAG: sulfite exporter TauE/SafE family protein, partial [Bacteroidales bacterium]|nr:sulfite exporter TauE/SafE family protein [Bacteroidales bacterium]
SLKVQFDDEKTSLTTIQKICAEKGYHLEWQPTSKKQQIIKFILAFLAFSGLCTLLVLARNFGFRLNVPEINSQMGNGMIFLVGLFTGLHCIGMCGCFIIGYTSKDVEHGRSIFRSHLVYGLGKTLSYALLGAFFGLLGSIFRITPLISGISISLAGTFLILYGLNMLHLFSGIKFLKIRQPMAITKYITKQKKQTNSPFFIGFFSGFILGCGPLQVMYIMAAGNGDALEGARFLTLFGLGTLPALFCFGFIARMLSNIMTRRFIYASGIILIILGSMMLNKGLIRARSGDDNKSMQPKHSCCEQIV